MRLLIIFMAVVVSAKCAKILCVFPGAAHSHYTIGSTLMKELAKRGHDVTMVSPFKEKEPIKNFKSVTLTGFPEDPRELFRNSNMFEMFNIPLLANIFVMGEVGLGMTENFLSNEVLQNILHGNETFDVVISEYFLNDALQGIAYQLKAPPVILSTLGPTIWIDHIMGNPYIYSYMPHLYLGYSAKMIFWQRVKNFLYCVLQRLYNNLYYMPQQNKILQKYIPDAPDIYELLHNTSLHLFNFDVSIGDPVPLLPNMIEIGGYHIKPPEKLPEDLQKYLDESEHGVIYFSMGGNLNSKDLPRETRDVILRVFSKLKQKVLWKFETDLPGKPDNVEIRKWLPQQDILAHPNIKLFISHGGILSITESVYHGVPILGLPVFGDQMVNMNNAVNNGFGIVLPYQELTEDTFSEALTKILTNPTYSENAKRRSNILTDKPIKPMDKAVYWVEYVARHGGAPHFKSAALDLTWYQYHSVDVILFLTLVTIALSKLFYMIIRRLFGGKKIQTKPKQKKN